MNLLLNRKAREDRQVGIYGKPGDRRSILTGTNGSHEGYGRFSGILVVVILWVYFGGACSGRPVPSPDGASAPESDTGSYQSRRSMTDDGPASIQENAPSSKSIVLTWQREGGFAGFCDELKIYLSGEIRTSSCRVPAIKTGRLSDEQQKRLNQWISTFGAIAIETKDSPSNDAMILKMTMKGTGHLQPTEADRIMLLDWAQITFDKNQP